MSDETAKLILEKLDEMNRRLMVLESGIRVTYSDVCEHEYPNPWFGTVPPACSKCGKPADVWRAGGSTSDGSNYFIDTNILNNR